MTNGFITLTASSGKCSGLASVVCPVGILTLTVIHQGAACDAASVHFRPTVRRTDIPVTSVVMDQRYLTVIKILD